MTYGDVPHQGRLWRYTGDTRERPRCLECRFEEFLARTKEEGVDRVTIETSFDPESTTRTPVQLKAEFNTVKWRSPDCSLPSDALRLANSIVDMAKRLGDAMPGIGDDNRRMANDRVVLPEFDAVFRYASAAIEDGLDSETMRLYLGRTRSDVGAYSPVSHEIDGRETITAAGTRELRLTHADRFERDIRNAVRQ